MPIEIERHDSKPNSVTTLVVRSVDGVLLARSVSIDNTDAIETATSELVAMVELHDAATALSWERLIRQVVCELREESAIPRTHSCGAACPVRVVHVFGDADGRTFSAQAVQDGADEDTSRLDEVRRSVALSVLGARNVTIANHRFWLDEEFESATHA